MGFLVRGRLLAIQCLPSFRPPKRGRSLRALRVNLSSLSHAKCAKVRRALRTVGQSEVSNGDQRQDCS